MRALPADQKTKQAFVTFHAELRAFDRQGDRKIDRLAAAHAALLLAIEARLAAAHARKAVQLARADAARTKRRTASAIGRLAREL
ncbi:MAG: hypothetical protein QM756_24075 [Polyangiaceae bacterium]